MARPDKAAAVAELTEDFRTANATVLTEYRGLTVTAMKQLRRALGADTKYSVVKNTLTKIAAKDAGVDISDDLLVGPSAVAFIKGDPINAAKSLRDFQKENPFLVIKGGIYEGKSITPAELMELANLESREVLLAKLAGAMKASMAKAAATFDALRAKMESGAPIVSEPLTVSEPSSNNAEAEVPAQAVTEEVVAVTETVQETETPEVVAVSEPASDDVVAEVPAQDVAADAVEVTEQPAE